jgi:hypothetical protein
MGKGVWDGKRGLQQRVKEKERRERKELKIGRYRYKLKIEDRQKVSEREINENVKRC